MTTHIDGEDWNISPEVWALFGHWYGDKAYRKAAFVAEFEAAVRTRVASEISERGYELRSSDEGISREEWACYGEAAEIARIGLARVRDE
ncbi:hypothetical protein [Streptomyces sp. NRRL F-5630]|uniref:hypothetical protein n=1 Tax=Streptomyces sp. NRRL F-5630 TaxID=1463864 RepID=UPI0004C75272|nr:hypothetical protein [Streptomyces sp. NRRL F-5630]